MEDVKPDPKYPLTISKDTQVKYAPLKNSPPDEWVIGIVHTVNKDQDDHTEHGAKCRFTNGKMGFVKEILTSFVLTENQVNELIDSDEGKKIERKESYLVDVATNTVKEWVKDQVVKEIAAFMNTDGGYVIIGQADNGSIVGIGPDLEYIHNTKRPEKDTVDDYKTKMEDYIFKKLSDKRIEEFVDIIVPKFQVKGKTICIIKVRQSPNIPALLHLNPLKIIDTKKDHYKEKDLSGKPAPLSESTTREFKNSELKPVIMYVRKNQKTVEADIRQRFNKL
jgi:predicted HTH transcriptional regulator